MSELFDKTVAADAAYHMPTYARKPVMFVEGRGMRLTDDDGREHLDFVAGIGAVNLGHSHPAVVEAVAEQIGRLTHVSNLYHVEHRAELAERLAGLFAGRSAATTAWQAFFCNSGAEANEGAVKLARKWGKAHRGAECVNVVTALGSFHGRTLAMLAATGQPAKQDDFAPLTPGFSHVPLNDIAALEAAVGPQTCAVLLEPVQGEGGVWPCDAEYLASVRRLCDEREVLLILDEVQTGCWRTGPFLAAQGYGVVPDIVALAKSLANGLPAGAVVAKHDVAAAFAPGDHGSTFGGGPVVCAAALATLGAMETEGLGANATAAGEYLRDGLRKVADETGEISDVRGAGLMVAASLTRPVAVPVAGALLERGLVVNNIGDQTIRVLPPLVCGEGEIDTLLGALHEVLPVVRGG